MKVTFLIRSLNFGGAERQLVALAKGLHERGCLVLVVVFYPGGLLENDLHTAGVPVAVLDKRGRWDVISFMWRLIRLVRQENPHILHGYLSVPNLLTIILKLISPNTRMVWGVRASNMDLDRYDWLSRMVFKAECFFSRFADLIIVNSCAGKDYHQKHGFPENKMVVVSNGIDTKRFKPDANARIRLRGEWRIGDQEKLIGLVGRIDPMKDHPTFLKAAALFAKERDDVRFVCIGDGPAPYKAEMLTLSNKLGLGGKLVWAGARSDMPAVYNALDIASSSSSGEGFPNVIGEAMSCGVPCVVTDVGDSAWIVGDAGVVVQHGKPEALLEGWKDCLERNLNELSVQARMRVENNFSLEQLIEQTEKSLM